MAKTGMVILLLTVLFMSLMPDSSHYRASGIVRFISDAPLEKIEASSANVKGIIDRETGAFAFSISIKSFEGFNSPLQKEHFNEHYLESKLYPKSTFTGKIIGFEDCQDDCDIKLTTKGKFTIHNITKVLIIPVHFKRVNEGVDVHADFEVKLDDFDIAIPKILESKISPVIQVAVDLKLVPSDE